jgi:hypothetical protein
MAPDRNAPQEDPPPPSRATIRETWWPRVDTVEAASRVARYGFWAAVLNAALTGLLLYLLLTGTSGMPFPATPTLIWWAAADIAISAVVAAGLWIYSPVAAVAGLVLFVASKLFGWLVASAQPNLTAILIAALFAYFYVLGARGTVARARLLRGAPGAGG